MTRARVAAETGWLPASALETVATETPAWAATSRIVLGRSPSAPFRLRLPGVARGPDFWASVPFSVTIRRYCITGMPIGGDAVTPSPPCENVYIFNHSATGSYRCRSTTVVPGSTHTSASPPTFSPVTRFRDAPKPFVVKVYVRFAVVFMAMRYGPYRHR